MLQVAHDSLEPFSCSRFKVAWKGTRMPLAAHGRGELLVEWGCVESQRIRGRGRDEAVGACRRHTA